MSTVLEAIWDRRDIRLDDWPLMSSPLPTLLLCSAYFYIVKIWGPQFMRDRKPYELKNTLIAYNVVQASPVVVFAVVIVFVVKLLFIVAVVIVFVVLLVFVALYQEVTIMYYCLYDGCFNTTLIML